MAYKSGKSMMAKKKPSKNGPGKRRRARESMRTQKLKK